MKKFEERSFKIGDKVKLLKNAEDDWTVYARAGEEGFIVGYKGTNTYSIKVSSGLIVRLSSGLLELLEESEEPSTKIKSDKPKLLVLGKKSSGKDTFCNILKANYGYIFESSSKRIIQEFFPLIQEVFEWESVEEAYENRDEMRPFLYQLIKGYNGRDNTRMARLILQDSDIYCGMRDSAEVEACLQAELFDLVIWVDAEKRLGDTEGVESCNVTKDLSDIIIENNEDEWEFTQKVKALMGVIER